MTVSVGGSGSGDGGGGGGGGDSARRREFVQVQSCVASGSIGSMMSLQIRASLV